MTSKNNKINMIFRVVEKNCNTSRYFGAPLEEGWEGVTCNNTIINKQHYVESVVFSDIGTLITPLDGDGRE